ncbi:MAG: helix-turn-helix domain-containing protein [Lachnospiraceae bacterium]|nr:helix-turn-helix domain-containing protein [Lachnospiraceae bacterium]
MNMKKTGEFLKMLRKEKGLTQEQLAEILLVSGRTVSRWETGTNMPDLAVLIQIAEFYEVEVKEILDGERKGGTMDKEWKETLAKVADYNKLEKEKSARADNLAFGFTFIICAALIVIQLMATGELMLVLGETVVLLVGGVAYIAVLTYNGVWETSSKFKNTPISDALVSIVCAAVFTIILAASYVKSGATASQAVRIATLFFSGIAAVGFALLRALVHFSRRRREKIQ